MKRYNNGIGESNVLQNQFTAYLVTAVHRKKIQYLRAKFRRLSNEMPLDNQEIREELQPEQDIISQSPLLEQLENKELHQALEQLKKRDFRILIMKISDERSFEEIANETGIGYKTVTSIYYRLIRKLRDELGGKKE
ncbi:sigma-70 family RNA polymerase sigma factor [Caproiciproducens sp. R1]|uniref:sigma-70 family RNA polymerase sigma factor n=1 Tax=Caproiciproducens sp. R1 TaxID=3435000 RepID=UPI0040338F22